MKKILLVCVILALTVGCNTKKVPYATFKREYKENRFTKQFQEADSVRQLLPDTAESYPRHQHIHYKEILVKDENKFG